MFNDADYLKMCGYKAFKLMRLHLLYRCFSRLKIDLHSTNVRGGTFHFLFNILITGGVHMPTVSQTREKKSANNWFITRWKLNILMPLTYCLVKIIKSMNVFRDGLAHVYQELKKLRKIEHKFKIVLLKKWQPV